MADLALAPELGQGADRLLVGDVRVGAMKLVEVDALDAQRAQAALERRAQVLRAAVRRPAPGAGAQQPALGGDHEAVGVRVQRLGDELLAHPRPVAVGGVDEVDAQLDGAAQHAPGLAAIGRVADDARAGDAHRAEAEAVHGEVAADGDGPGDARQLRHLNRPWSIPCSVLALPGGAAATNAQA